LQNKDVARIDQNATAIYLTYLNSGGGRRTMKQALNVGSAVSAALCTEKCEISGIPT
jgi:hypothetical protein